MLEKNVIIFEREMTGAFYSSVNVSVLHNDFFKIVKLDFPKRFKNK